MINVFYRGPLERSRLGFLLELFSSLNKKVSFYWLLPHPKFQNKDNKVVEPFMEGFPKISYEIIPAGFQQIVSARNKTRKIITAVPNAITVSIGFTAPFFVPRTTESSHIWCVNGIPEEVLLHKNTFLKRKEVEFKWSVLSKIYNPEIVITVSNRMSNYISHKCGLGKMIALPLCVNQDIFGFAGTKKYYTYAGSGAPWQNLKQLSEVWGSLYKMDSSIRFRVISRDSRANILGSQVPTEAIEFVGTSDLDVLAQYLSEAEVGFLIRKDELINRVSFPTKLSEYLASGSWAVVSDIDWDIADLIKKHSVGILVPPAWSADQIAIRILEARKEFEDKEQLKKRLTSALKELSKVHWLEEGRERLLESDLFSN